MLKNFLANIIIINHNIVALDIQVMSVLKLKYIIQGMKFSLKELSFITMCTFKQNEEGIKLV